MFSPHAWGWTVNGAACAWVNAVFPTRVGVDRGDRAGSAGDLGQEGADEGGGLGGALHGEQVAGVGEDVELGAGEQAPHTGLGCGPEGVGVLAAEDEQRGGAGGIQSFDVTPHVGGGGGSGSEAVAVVLCS